MINLPAKTNIHIIGIGGIGMSAIAEILLDLGYPVSGSDQSENQNTIKLASRGAKIYKGHLASNVGEAQVVVHSSAIPETNPEIQICHEKNIPLLRRSEILSDIMRLKSGIAVAGTHGKTTTTSIVSTIFAECDQDPTFLIGGIVKNLSGHARVGKEPWFIAEADESDGTFLELTPILSTITNIDFDHLDYYGSKDNLIEAFEKFANRVPFYGQISLNVNDVISKEISGKVKSLLSGTVFEKMKLKKLIMSAQDISVNDNGSEFKLFFNNELVGNVQTSLIGDHNVENILAAISIAHGSGLAFDRIIPSISKFTGVGRRMQTLYKNDYLTIVDDYGHHPTEVKATLKAARNVADERKLVAVFQPHRYSRTKDCWEDFLHCFNDVDHLYMLPVYSAGETEVDGINSRRLVDDINQLHPKLVTLIEDLDEITEFKSTGPSLIISLGAEL